MNASAHAQAHEDPTHHHIASFRSLFTVLLILLTMTALTVYTGKFVHIGEAGNLILAMAIAIFKASLVCAIFMHLLHDKFLNTVVLVLCLALVITFIGFVSIDMTSRGDLDPTREHFIGPPPVADAEIQAAIEKAQAAHAQGAEHAPEAGDHQPEAAEHNNDAGH